MKTALEIVDLLWEKLDGSDLEMEITGSLCKHRRDPDSNQEDVVISCQPVSNEQLQRALAEVNIYVPDLVVMMNEVEDKQPNHGRLQFLESLAADLLRDNWTEDLNYDIKEQGLVSGKDSPDHYINIKLEFFILNI